MEFYLKSKAVTDTLLFDFFFYQLCFLLFVILFYFLTLQYCIGFAIYRNESATGIHSFYVLCIAYFTKLNLCERGLFQGSYCLLVYSFPSVHK